MVHSQSDMCFDFWGKLWNHIVSTNVSLGTELWNEVLRQKKNSGQT